MVDEIDRAVALQEALLADAMRSFRAHLPGPQSEAPPVECLACGETIPAARRAAMPRTCLCIDCQDELERRL